MLGEISVGEIFYLDVCLENASSQSWVSTEYHSLNLSYHWLDRADNSIIFEGERTSLPVSKIMPGQMINARMCVIAPNAPGYYRLLLVPLQEKHCWFDEKGFNPFILELDVVAQGTARCYAGADIRLFSQVGQ